jgi:hypothetical protein
VVEKSGDFHFEFDITGQSVNTKNVKEGDIASRRRQTRRRGVLFLSWWIVS